MLSPATLCRLPSLPPLHTPVWPPLDNSGSNSPHHETSNVAANPRTTECPVSPHPAPPHHGTCLGEREIPSGKLLLWFGMRTHRSPEGADPPSWAMTKEVSGIQWQVSVSGGRISFRAISNPGATGRSNKATTLRRKRPDWTKGPRRGQPEGQLTPASYCDTQRTQNPGGQVWGALPDANV